MDRPELFGRDLSATWRAAEGIADAGHLAAAYRHHLVAIAVRAHLHREGRSIEDFANQLHMRPRRLGQKLNGSVQASGADLYSWVLVTDLSVLPEEPSDRSRLLPPTTGTHHFEE